MAFVGLVGVGVGVAGHKLYLKATGPSGAEPEAEESAPKAGHTANKPDRIFSYRQKEVDKIFSMVCVGEQDVGKTCLVQRYIKDEFKEHTTPTIGCDLQVKHIHHRGQAVQLMLYDTAGMERFRFIVSSYYRKANGAVLAFDLTSRESFETIETHWLPEVDRYAPQNVFKLLVGTKSDLTDHRAVGLEEVTAFAREHGLAYVETSAKADKDSVAKAFEKMVDGMIGSTPLGPVVRETISLSTQSGTVLSGYCCA